ncbi:TrkH family potassium uptake protein [Porticoccus litoralis]|uniref:Trk system potassium uptake protein n=1 Tax=Porticoccus litoralis TaxID=434086 RepID=A0AAW8B4W2_9GAMM|nr:TrkH family potassium uptake protein [Porticoccus litoralis]MDP1520782.1 TrkH family potassium uptake protein [Porticoccus litoralis]
MQFRIISKVLGLMMMIFSLTLLTPIAIAAIYGENTHQAFFFSFAITFSLGMLLWLPYSRMKGDLRTRDGFVITTLFWTVLSLVGSLPFILVDAIHLHFTDAVFESISGLTTTGATVITGLDYLPKSILYYRQQLHWLGGIGIVVIAIAIMPMLGVGGMQLYKAETPGPVKDNKMTPRITQTAKALFTIYLSLTIICSFAYWLAGMNTFDAITHAFSTIATGGFANYDASIGYFNSPTIMMLAVFFMIISGISFGLHYYAWVKGSVLHYWHNSESKMYLNMIIGGSIICCGYLFLSGSLSLTDSLLHGVFQLVSIMTSTGFATTNFSNWPTFLPVFLIVLSFFGACAGSTGGGIKVGRMLILAKQSLREIYRLIHPSAIFPIKLRNRTVPERVADSVWAFFGIYLAIFYFLVMLLQFTGLDYLTAWSCTAAALNNLGPGLGDAAAHYGEINSTAKWLLSAAMIIGRLEIFTVLVLFTPMFWRR